MSASPDGRRAQLDGTEALVLVALAFALMWLLGGMMVARWGVVGLGVAEIVLVLAPTVAWLLVRRVSLVSALALGPPRPLALLGGVLAGLGAFELTAAILEAAQEKLMPVPPALRDELRRLLVPASGPRPLLVDWLALALLPALCEEALFRGALLGALRKIGPAAALTATALAFGFYHGSAYKVLPTAALGVALAGLAWRARSLWPSVLLHLVNNTLVIVLVRAGIEEPPPVTTPLGAGLCGLALVALVGGIWLVRQDRTTHSAEQSSV